MVGGQARPRYGAIVLTLLGMAFVASTAAAADRVKVVAPTATIRAEARAASKAVAVVAAGTVLDVLGRENGWYKVSVHAGGNRAARPGYVEEKSVVPTTERAVLVPVGPTGAGGGAPAPAARAGESRVRGFGEVAFQRFAAGQSFKAIFDNADGLFYGGGVDLGIDRNLFVTIGVTHFQKTGQRAFAYNGQAFRLGVADDVSITPVTLNVGYRFAAPRRRLTPYVAGGGGAVFYRETSDAATSDENVSKTGGAFEALGGVEYAVARTLAIAVEGQYQFIPNILGKTGVSQAFGEKNLGGASVRVKILFGR